MGSDLTAAPDGKAIRLMIRALRDPDGANLDRVQIITGWLDGSGDLQEKIYDIACSDDLPVGENNRCGGLVGSTVNVADLVHAMRTSLGNSAACRLSEQRNSSPRYKTVLYLKTTAAQHILHRPQNRLECAYSHFYAQPDLSET